MAKDKTQVIFEGLVIKYRCLTTSNSTSVAIQDVDLDTMVEPCEICGAHGYVRVSVWCPECAKSHVITLREW